MAIILNILLFICINGIIFSNFFSKVLIYLSTKKEIPDGKRFKTLIGIETFLVILYLFLAFLLITLFKNGFINKWWEIIIIVLFTLYFALANVFTNKFSHNITEKQINNIFGLGLILFYVPFFLPVTFLIFILLQKQKKEIISKNFPIYLTENQLRTIIEKDSELEKDEKDMLTSIIGFANIKASEIMIPRTSVVSIGKDAEFGNILSLFKEKGISRLPVYKENLDNIVGILYLKDLIGISKEDFILSKFVRKPIFMPETVKLDELLKVMIEKKMQMIIILDEYGGTSGILTMEDIIEEVVGEIEDEYDTHRKDIEKVDKNTYKVKASVEIEDINEKLGINIPKQDVETVGGFVLTLVERIPKKGETFKYNNLHFRILDADDRKINWLLLSIKQKVKNEKTE
jgi:CBS domain containing-hemolysin-like protein